MNNGAQETNKPTLESETCTRCGGSGNFSRCAMYGTRCFRCGGKGRTLTARGAAAAKYRDDLRCVNAIDLEVGQKIWDEGFAPAGLRAGWRDVEFVTPGSRPEYVDVYCADGRSFVFTTTQRVRVAQSAEQIERTNRMTAEYQSTLTLKGTPRKRAT